MSNANDTETATDVEHYPFDRPMVGVAVTAQTGVSRLKIDILFEFACDIE